MPTLTKPPLKLKPSVSPNAQRAALAGMESTTLIVPMHEDAPAVVIEEINLQPLHNAWQEGIPVAVPITPRRITPPTLDDEPPRETPTYWDVLALFAIGLGSWGFVISRFIA